MATLPLNRARPGPGPMEIRTVGEAAGESFHQGEFVYLVAGLATACATSGKVIYGMAQSDATSVTSADIDIVLANPTQTFIMTSSEASAAAIAATDLGVKYGLRVANNRSYVNPAEAGQDALLIREVLNDGVENGDLNPEVLVTVLPEAFQGGAAAT